MAARPGTAEHAFESWFDSDTKFADLPKELQKLVKRGMIPLLWDTSPPGRRRNMVRDWDCEHHPDLAQAHEAVWQKMGEISDCERTASRVPLEYRTMADVELKETKLRHLREELAAAEAALQQAAERCLGPELADVGPVTPPMPPAPPPKPSSNGRDYRGADALLVADMRKVMADDKTKGVMEAARAVVARAEGKGSPESKVTRLVLRYRETHSTEQS